MRKLPSFIIASIALIAFASPVQAYFGGSVRGDIGMLGNQVPYFILQTGNPPTTKVDTTDYLSCRKENQWDFTGRLFVYTTCDPCPTYIAGSWQGSNHTVYSCQEAINDINLGSEVLIPLRILNQFNLYTSDALINIENGSPVASKIKVKNKFSKAKLGVGFDLIKTRCFSFTMEAGGNYLDTQLQTDQDIIITQTVAQGPGYIVVPPGNLMCSAGIEGLPFDYIIHNNTWQKTEGVGLYTSIKAEYKLPATCLGNCFSIYGKAEVADIIGHQKYRNTVCYVNAFSPGSFTPIVPPEVFEYNDDICNRYNNIVEVDLEAALVYSPCFKCWSNLDLNFSLGARADSFVNLFSKASNFMDVSYLSLTRPTVFLEVGMKI